MMALIKLNATLAHRWFLVSLAKLTYKRLYFYIVLAFESYVLANQQIANIGDSLFAQLITFTSYLKFAACPNM